MCITEMSIERSIKLNTGRDFPEILAPAGTVEAMRAAVNAGCDAVYMGGDMFSARAYAGNFGTEEMAESIDYCHVFDVKVYMTVNTLLKEKEIGRLKDYMKPFYDAGLDGVIVQDMGVAGVLMREYPDLPLHASTQMSISSEYGAWLMKHLGFTRIVPSRELSLKEIAGIKEKVDIEIESFVHGAMCYAYSGKCLFSGFLGGRSGNRGRCAQPCRQKYEIISEHKNRSKKAEAPYILSLKDMCTLSVLPQLIDTGIDSFKIEGRMKNPTYVAATVDAYRQARDLYLQFRRQADKKTASDNCFASWEDLSEKMQNEYLELSHRLTLDMQDIYNRGGFSTGYYFMEKGREMAADIRPNHMGTIAGEIADIKGSDIRIKLLNDINPQDVLEIIDAGVELTSNVKGMAGDTVVLKGKELKKLRPGMKINRTRNNKLISRIEEDLVKHERKVDAYALIRAKTGEPLKIIMTNVQGSGWTEPGSDHSDRTDPGAGHPVAAAHEIIIKAEGHIVGTAQKAPVDARSLAAKMQKTGGTNLNIITECDIDKDAFVAMSDFNDTRRYAMELFKQALSARYHRNKETVI